MYNMYIHSTYATCLMHSWVYAAAQCFQTIQLTLRAKKTTYACLQLRIYAAYNTYGLRSYMYTYVYG